MSSGADTNPATSRILRPL